MDFCKFLLNLSFICHYGPFSFLTLFSFTHFFSLLFIGLARVFPKNPFGAFFHHFLSYLLLLLTLTSVLIFVISSFSPCANSIVPFFNFCYCKLSLLISSYFSFYALSVLLYLTIKTFFFKSSHI